MARRLPPLNALRAFEVSARTGSFTLAAQELRVSQGAVSRQVAHLEAYLGIGLFDRHHRQIKLTREGEIYFASLATAFDYIERGTQQLHRAKRQPSLRLHIFPTLAYRWLVPRLGDFHERHPDIDVQLTTSMQSANLDHDEVDLTVEFGKVRRADWRYDSLFEIELIPVCSKKLLKGPPGLRKPEDLLKQVLLHAIYRPDDWKHWMESVDLRAPVITSGLQFGNSAMVYQAAGNSVGIAIAQRRFVADDVASGKLVTPFTQTIATGEIYYLVSHQASEDKPEIVKFRDWMLAEARKDQ